jgi:hypothetical protein
MAATCQACAWLRHAKHVHGCDMPSMCMAATRQACAWLRHAKHVHGCDMPKTRVAETCQPDQVKKLSSPVASKAER